MSIEQRLVNIEARLTALEDTSIPSADSNTQNYILYWLSVQQKYTFGVGKDAYIIPTELHKAYMSYWLLEDIQPNKLSCLRAFMKDIREAYSLLPTSMKRIGDKVVRVQYGIKHNI